MSISSIIKEIVESGNKYPTTKQLEKIKKIVIREFFTEPRGTDIDEEFILYAEELNRAVIKKFLEKQKDFLKERQKEYKKHSNAWVIYAERIDFLQLIIDQELEGSE